MRLALMIAKRHRRSREFGWSVVAFRSPGQLGLITLSESSAPPGPSGTGGESRMPAVNDVGKPDEGEPHVRFDGRELETEHLATVTGVAQPAGKPAEQKAPGPTARNCHRASSRPSQGTPCFPGGFPGVVIGQRARGRCSAGVWLIQERPPGAVVRARCPKRSEEDVLWARVAATARHGGIAGGMRGGSGCAGCCRVMAR